MEYQTVHTTLVNGELDPTYFGMHEEDAAALNNLTDILTTPHAMARFNSIGRYADAPAEGGYPRWKFFSSTPLDTKVLDEVLKEWEGSSVLRHTWDSPGAYPRSSKRYAEFESSFILDETSRGSVLFPSALELGTSAMEVMAVAAKNVALLVADKEKVKRGTEKHEAEWAAIAGVGEPLENKAEL